MLINPKKLLRRERQLKALIGMSGKEFKILYSPYAQDEFFKLCNSKKAA